MRNILKKILLATVCGLTFTPAAQEIQTLPGTGPLTWVEPLDIKMMDGADRYIEKKIADSIHTRQGFWNRDTSTHQDYDKSVEPNRRRFMKYIGMVDERVPVRMERFGDVGDTALVAETAIYKVYQVRWTVFERVTGEGLLVEPKGKPVGHVIAIPDADQTPEQVLGLAEGVPLESQFARQLAESGFLVVVPVLLDRTARWSGDHISFKGSDPVPYFTNMPHREWIHLMAFMMGRHVIGYEVAKMMAVVDWIEKKAGEDSRIGIAGYAEGGLIAFYTAAVDTRIDGSLVSGYFKSRQESWEEPIYRHVWALLHEFGDAEIASLIAPRGLVIEYSEEPDVDSGPGPTPAPGRLETPDFESVMAEFNRIDTLLKPGFQTRHFVHGIDDKTVAPGSVEALKRFTQLLDAESSFSAGRTPATDQRRGFDPAVRQKRQVEELEHEVQWLIPLSDQVRNRFCRKLHPWIDKLFGENHGSKWAGATDAETYSATEFAEESGPLRKYFWEEVLGKLNDPVLPMNPRSRKVYDTEKWVGYDVVLDVMPDLFAWGLLVVPKDLKPGEKRPIVVCQHGGGGLPEHMVIADKNNKEAGAFQHYQGVASDLADRGFVVFAPHNPYRIYSEHRFRILDRKANLVKASLFSFILAQHDQILNWFETLPFVDPGRIGYYGLSYGGETAVRVPPILERYSLSICSADFNDWTRKVATCHDRYSMILANEWEHSYFDMGSTFNYAEMVYLMIPRPFMVERGHHDTVSDDSWVAFEYSKVRWMYDQLDIGDRTEIEFHNGGHTMQKKGTFDFLHKHLNWPKPD